MENYRVFKNSSHMDRIPLSILCIGAAILLLCTVSFFAQSQDEETASQDEKNEDALLTIKKLPSYPSALDEEDYSCKKKGNDIVEVDWDTGNLVVRNTETNEKRNLTNKGSWEDSDDYAEECFLAEDGDTIVYTRYNSKTEKYELHTINFDGSNDRTLFKEERFDYVSIEKKSPEKPVFTILYSENEARFGFLSMDDSSFVMLQKLKRTSDSWLNASLSSDGESFLFEKNDANNKSDIYLYDIAGKTTTPLVEHPADDRFLGWSTDENWFFFMSDRLSSPSLWGVQSHESDSRIRPTFIKQFPSTTSLSTFYLRKDVLFFLDSCEFREQYQVEMDIETGRFMNDPKLTRMIVNEPKPTGVGSTPKVVFDINQNSEQTAWGMYIRKKDVDSETYDITFKNTPYKNPEKYYSVGGGEWTQDGRYLLTDIRFAYYPKYADIYLLDSETGDLKLVLNKITRSVAGYAEDEDHFYYVTRDDEDGMSNLVKRNFQSGEEKVIHTAKYSDWGNLSDIRLSYDKNQAVYFDEDDFSITLIQLSDGSSRVLYDYKESKTTISSLTWTLDNQYLLYVIHTPQSSRSKETTMWKLSIHGDDPQKLWTRPEFIPWYHVETGNQLFFTIQTRDRNFWSMENFIPE